MEKNLSDTVADRLKRAREAKGWSQIKLSEVSGVSRRTIEDIERPSDKARGANLQTIRTLAYALDVLPAWLACFDE